MYSQMVMGFFSKAKRRYLQHVQRLRKNRYLGMGGRSMSVALLLLLVHVGFPDVDDINDYTMCDMTAIPACLEDSE